MMSTPDLVNLANKPSHTLDELPIIKTLKFLIFNSGKWRPLNETKILLVSAIIPKIQDPGKETVTNLSASGTFRPLTSLSNVLLILNPEALRNYRGSSQSSLLIRETFVQIGDQSLPSPNWHHNAVLEYFHHPRKKLLPSAANPCFHSNSRQTLSYYVSLQILWLV